MTKTKKRKMKAENKFKSSEIKEDVKIETKDDYENFENSFEFRFADEPLSPNLSSETLDKMVELFIDGIYKDELTLIYILRHNNIYDTTLTKIFNIVYNDYLNFEEDEYGSSIFNELAESNLSYCQLDKLSKIQINKNYVVMSIAQNKNTSEDTLDFIINYSDNCYKILNRVIYNNNTKISTLYKILERENISKSTTDHSVKNNVIEKLKEKGFNEKESTNFFIKCLGISQDEVENKKEPIEIFEKISKLKIDFS